MGNGQGLDRLRRNPVYQAIVKELDRLGIPHTVEWGRHAKVVFTFRGVEVKHPVSMHPKKNVAGIAAADIRRVIAEIERRPRNAPGQASVSEAEPAPAPPRDHERTRTMEDITSPAPTSTELDIGLHPFDHEARVRDVDLAEKLGFERPLDIRELIKRNEAELKSFGAFPFRTEKSGGRPGVAFFLNEEQALLISVLSRAPRAPIVRAMLIRVFTAWRHGTLAPPPKSVGLTNDDTLAIGGVVKAVVRKQTEDLRAGIDTLVEAVAEITARMGSQPEQASPVADGVTAHEVVARMAEVPADRQFNGLAGQVSSRLSRFCARGGYTVRMLDTRPGEKLVFPRAAAAEWLASGGRAEIWQLVNHHRDRRAGQGRLALRAV